MLANIMLILVLHLNKLSIYIKALMQITLKALQKTVLPYSFSEIIKEIL